MQHVAQMLKMELIPGWFWCWKRLGMHKGVHTHRLTWKALGNSACGLSLETKNPLGAFMKGFGDAD